MIDECNNLLLFLCFVQFSEKHWPFIIFIDYDIYHAYFDDVTDYSSPQFFRIWWSQWLWLEALHIWEFVDHLPEDQIEEYPIGFALVELVYQT